ncbi:MAG: hypothetical protein ACOYEP_04435 [Limnochordia bacterium]|jgi:hypothetical protein
MQDRLFVDGCTVSIETPAQANSFLLALQAALRAAARPTSYSMLAGITGVAFRAVPWEYDEQKGWEELAVRMPFIGDALGVRWSIIGSDSAANETEKHGKRPGSQTTLLRTQTAPKIAQTVWDDQAIEDIRLLLRRGTPTMVFGGWPGAHAHLWGLIVGWQNDIFYGFHTRSSALELLVQPPYVALCFDNPNPPRYSATDMARLSLVLCSPAAESDVYDLWADFLLAPHEDPDAWMCHLRLATLTRDARMAALRYLSEVSELLPGTSTLQLSELDFCYSQTTRSLIRDVDRSYVRAAFTSPDELQEMRERVLLIKRHESRAAEVLSRLAEDLK